jgi:hypothetical protein
MSAIGTTFLSPSRRARRSLLGLATLALAVVATSAHAEEGDKEHVSTKVNAKGEIVAQLKIAAKPAKVRELLGSAERSHSLAPTTVAAKATPDGNCERVKLKTRGILQPLEIETRRCPTASGFKETMVASKDFLEYYNEWTVQESGDGSLVVFTSRTVPNVAIPEAILQSETRRVLGRVMRNLSSALSG